MDNHKNRELLPDVLKGFAILMVVFGHCIQECNGVDFKSNTMYFQDKVYQFIYSFHMPLFMMISGYFAWDSIEKMQNSGKKWKMLIKRSVMLTAPILGWTCFDYIRLYAEFQREYYAFWSLELLVKSFANSLLTNAWFLWAVFWCFLAVFLVHCYGKDSVILYGIGFLVMFVIPDGLGLGAYKYMMPYFIASFYFRGWLRLDAEDVRKRNPYIEKIKNKSEWFWIITLGVSYGVLFTLFCEDAFIYLSGYKLIGKNVLRQLWIDFYRMLIGFVGAGFFILVWRMLVKSVSERYRFPIMTAFGKNSLGIYIISGYFILKAGSMMDGAVQVNYGRNLLQAVIVVLISYVLTAVLKRIPFLKWLVGC